MNRIPIKEWASGLVEVERCADAIQRERFRVPYPIRSYCLGLARGRGAISQLLYWLFPCLHPELQDQAVAAMSIRVDRSESGKAQLRLSVDTLSERELSEQNRREIREAKRALGFS